MDQSELKSVEKNGEWGKELESLNFHYIRGIHRDVRESTH